MKRGLTIILTAQFFSALADNALLFSAIALLLQLHAPTWQVPVLQQCFVLSYIALAPFVGPLADALPKGHVMWISNMIKLFGCVTMLFGLHPLFAYGIVGIGAAMYSPAKYGILTEFLPPEKLVMANGWMEGLTVAAIIFGAVMGGSLVSPTHASNLLDIWQSHGLSRLLDTPPEIAILLVTVLYLIAALFNFYIPKTAIDHKLPKKTMSYILRDFGRCFLQLWRDPLGQVSLAVTSLFWGAGNVLRLIVLTWAGVALTFNLEKATQLTAVVVVGTALGAAAAAKFVKLERAVKVLPLGIFMGVAVTLMAPVTDWRVAIGILILIGALGGLFVVPMNALLQHRGHLLMGAGHSIAVQNFNENISILVMLGLYALMIKLELPIYSIVIAFGLFVTVSMLFLYRKHRHDQD